MYSTVEDSVLLPNVKIGRNVKIKHAVVDKDCILSEGLVVGYDPIEDAKHILVAANGVTLITPGMLGQDIGRNCGANN